MRKAQKQEVLEFINSLHQAHMEIKEALQQHNYDTVQNMLSECQDFAVTLGENIERLEGEEHITVSHVEEYCETLFRVFKEITDGEVNENKIYKILKRQLLNVENSVKNDISVKTEVVFFPYKASMWDSLESVYLAAKEDTECDAYCVPIPYFDLNPDHSFGKMHYEGSEYPEGIEIIDWEKYNFEDRRPDVIYIHNPYDGCNLVTSVHPRYYSSNLKKYTDTLVYVPYYVTSGSMMEAQSLLPAYLYVDYIVIQSPQFRECFDKSIPDEKFLPFGSPKVDRVLNKCKKPPNPPKEWREKMYDGDGRKKRVIFYNTSLGDMLVNTETFLKKMEYVFKCFEEEREDVCLLWRPHPLMEATLDSLRPEFRIMYETLKKKYIESGLGIYDATPDVTDAVALSDAYIGDAGSSITSLFGVAGKPIFILNNQIHEKPGEDSWHGKVSTGFDFQEQDRFTIIQGNKLYISEPGQYRYRYFCDLSNNRVREYYTILQIDSKMYAYPLSVQNILVIGDNGVERTIELKKETADGQMFFWGWKFDKFLILHPLNYPALVRVDTTTGECLYVKENIEVYVKEKDGHKITGGSFISRGNLYLASPTDNKVCRFDINSGEMQVIELPIQNRCGCNGLVEYMGEIWMRPYTGKVITCWNPQTGKTIEYTGFPEGFSCERTVNGEMCEEMPFSSVAFYGDYVYLAPQYANMFLRLDIRTGQFMQWKTPLEEEIDQNEVVRKIGGINSSFSEWWPKGESGCFHLYCHKRQRLYNVHMKTGIWEEVEISFDMKELQEHSIQFRENSDLLKYACFESIFNPLDRFLGDVTMGNSFERDRQLSAFGEITENIDGSCGRKVYRYIAEQG